MRKMMKTWKIKHCPFCRAKEPARAAGTKGKGFAVTCSCGARGPRAATAVGAITLWNVRCRENESVSDVPT